MGLGIGIGPRLFRVRVSTRGVGLSSGIGPVSIWTSTSGARRRNQVRVRTGSVYYYADPAPRYQARTSSNVAMHDVTGLSALSLQPTGPDDLVRQLNEASRMALWPWAAGVTAFSAIASANTWWLALLVLVVGLAITVPLFLHQRVRNHVEVSYDVEGPVAEWFNAIVNGWPALQRLGGAWRITTSGAVQTTYQHKTNAGASAIVARTRTLFPLAPPRVLRTNVATPALSAGGQNLYVLPDRILVKSGKRWSDVGYNDLRVTSRPQQFIEDERPPSDSQQVGTTWKYVNVKGGPDRRFKDNRQFPVMLYGRIEIASRNGLNWILDLSQPAMAEWAANLLRSRPTTIPDAPRG